MLIHTYDAPDGVPVRIRFPEDDLRDEPIELLKVDPLARGVREALFVVEQGQRWNAAQNGATEIGDTFSIKREGWHGFEAYTFADFWHEYRFARGLPEPVAKTVALAGRAVNGYGDLRAPPPGSRGLDPQDLSPVVPTRPGAEVRDQRKAT